MTGISLAGESARLRVRRLDSCLTLLEEANVRGDTAVGAEIVERIRTELPQLQPGIGIRAAIEMVFAEQRSALEAPHPVAKARSDVGQGDAWLGGRPKVSQALSPEAARALTDQIKARAREMSLLLVEAHDRKAWKALGYRSWTEYSRKEFGFSRPRSYELVVHGRVIKELTAAVGDGRVPEVSPYAAFQIRNRLGHIQSDLSERLRDGAAEPEATAIVQGYIDELRQSAKQGRSAEASAPSQMGVLVRFRREDPVAVAHWVRQAVRRLASEPVSPAAIAELIADDAEVRSEAERAARWLADLALACEKRRVDSPDSRTPAADPTATRIVSAALHSNVGR
jgi:hypothetical protein